MILCLRNSGLVKHRKVRQMPVISKISFSQTSPQRVKLMAGTSKGLLYYDGNCVHKIMDGPVYGISKYVDHVYALQRLDKKARIIKFKYSQILKEMEQTVFEVLIDDLSIGVHQIDFIGDRLFVCDTYNNRILIYRSNGTLVQVWHPSGELANHDIYSLNYKHYNSVYCDFDYLYIVAHNDTKKSGRKSEIHIVDFFGDFQSVERQSINAICAHNYMKWRGKSCWCDSLRGALFVDGKSVLRENEIVTRGLAANDEYIFVGGSNIAFGESRLNGDGTIFCLDQHYEKINTIKINNCGAVSEIRLMEKDYGLSNINFPSIE